MLNELFQHTIAVYILLIGSVIAFSFVFIRKKRAK